MISKIRSIGNLAVFQGFDWDKEVLDEKSNVREFKHINIFYGRNYSGKTSLSRILRAMETGALSDKYHDPAFCVEFSDKSLSDHNTFTSQGRTIRVFNEDFVRENLRFIINPDDNIESFAILGDDNNKIEKEIEILKSELGSQEAGKETGLYAQQFQHIDHFDVAKKALKDAQDALDKQLSNKATGREVGIKYKPERFGDQNYTKPKLEKDIKIVLKVDYQQLSDEQKTQYEKLIAEKTLRPTSPFNMPALRFSVLSEETKALVIKKISESDKIEELVKDAVLNRWVNDGRGHHKERRTNCAFCGNYIAQERWEELEKHFDEESEMLEKDIDSLIAKVGKERNLVLSALKINKELFYSKFHKPLDGVQAAYESVSKKYVAALDSLIDQLDRRKDDLINPKEFTTPFDCSSELTSVWEVYESICQESNAYSDLLGVEQDDARDALRLREVSDFVATIKYSDQVASIDLLDNERNEAETKRNDIADEIQTKIGLIESKKHQMNDEEKGAIRVNEFLSSFFGHNFLSLEARNVDDVDADSKKISFEVIRDGKKAYHLSEGECSLLAFCYFLAKLEDVDTKDSQPIIWIDDPISSLDGNHIFFVYSLINAEIVSSGNFKQLFVSTHNLDFLKYLKRLNGEFLNHNNKMQPYDKEYFVIRRNDKVSTINPMPKYLQKYVTEFNYLFHQIYKCAAIEVVNDTNYTTFYNFGNNARKFLEIYLYYKYPDTSKDDEKLQKFFGDGKVPALLTDRINNEYSHLSGVFERGATPVEVPEMKTVAQQIIKRLQVDNDQYEALVKSVGEEIDEAV